MKLCSKRALNVTSLYALSIHIDANHLQYSSSKVNSAQDFGGVRFNQKLDSVKGKCEVIVLVVEKHP